jgi:hypothetical protein
MKIITSGERSFAINSYAILSGNETRLTTKSNQLWMFSEIISEDAKLTVHDFLTSQR